ncbi:MAG: hypothetical protein COB46_03560 [Rhodospirillaceae bacterium]|nr:MAG: hypothetical protein COB46_03560 [Rhodospirillaceae bacterium]
MLNAVGQKKAKIKDAVDAKRHPTEDIITSSVFGPLAYFEANDALTFMNALMEEVGFTQESFFKNCSSLDFKFWPRLPVVNSTYRKNYIEPDLVITGKQGDDKYILIIEVKWGAELETDQLKDQWNAAQELEPSAKIHHLLLVRNKGDKDQKQLKQHQKNCTHASRITWHDVSKITAPLKLGGEVDKASGLKSWKNDVHTFLKIMGVSSQSGWGSIGLQDVLPLPDRGCKLLAFLSAYQVGWVSRDICNPNINGSRNGVPIVKNEEGQVGWSIRLL